MWGIAGCSVLLSSGSSLRGPSAVWALQNQQAVSVIYSEKHPLSSRRWGCPEQSAVWIDQSSLVYYLVWPLLSLSAFPLLGLGCHRAELFPSPISSASSYKRSSCCSDAGDGCSCVPWTPWSQEELRSGVQREWRQLRWADTRGLDLALPCSGAQPRAAKRVSFGWLCPGASPVLGCCRAEQSSSGVSGVLLTSRTLLWDGNSPSNSGLDGGAAARKNSECLVAFN